MIRLDKFLTDMGCGTRSIIKNLVRKGKVSVNGEVIKKPEIKINEDEDVVLLDGEEIKYNRYEYFMLNKPYGYVSATTDRNEKTVLDLLKAEDRRKDLFPVGRLDKDTEGLLVISNDGEMAHKILSPKNHIVKTYYVRVSGRIENEHIDTFEKGIDIGEKNITKPGILKIIKSGDISEAELTIYEGKFHQVKRMFEAVGMKVVYLKRIKMGTLGLDETLKPGEYRRLTLEETEQLKG